MEEAGVDISAQESHSVDAFLTKDIDVAFILCDATARSCPRFPPPVRMILQPFDDPKQLAEGLVEEEDILGVYRRIRDEIRLYVQGLPRLLECSS